MVKRILWTMAFSIFIGSGVSVAQTSPNEVHKKVSNTIATESKAQVKADDWNWEKDSVLNDIREKKLNIDWKKYKQEKYKIYIKGVKENIKLYEFKKDELQTLRKNLEPYLEQVVDKMAAFIEQDLPFWVEDRKKRVSNLRNSLNNYKYKMSEKMRQVFAEGLQLETEFGARIQPIKDITLKLNGIETQVTLMKIGRVNMYYMSINEKQIGMWDKKTKQWVALPDELIKNFKEAFDMALANRAPEIVELPLGAI